MRGSPERPAQFQTHRQILEAETQLRESIGQSLREFNRKIEATLSTTPTLQRIQEVNQNAKRGLEKKHTYSQSLLTSLMQISDYKTIYNMVAASFIPLTIMLIMDNVNHTGSLLDLATLKNYFDKFDKGFICWWFLACFNYLVILIVYGVIKNKWSRCFWVTIYAIYQITLLSISTIFVEKFQPGFATCLVIMIEGARMMMKAHSYLRNKLLYCTDNEFKNFSPEIFKQKKYDLKPPTFNYCDLETEIRRYSYFFVAPTLIYRDTYILTQNRSMGKAFIHFLNFTICFYYAFMVQILCCKPVIENLGRNLTTTEFVTSVLRLMLPSMLFLILGFFGFLHSWLNCWAELTRFPDRIFYLDWWNSVEFGTYYRKWNIVVHDWLYYYVYLDVARFFPRFRDSKTFPQLLTFLISAVIHELILVEASGFFYPVLFLMFTGPGIILIQNQKNFKLISMNFFFWIEMYLGTSLLFVLYLTEYYARSIVNREKIVEKWGMLEFMIPRTIYLR